MNPDWSQWGEQAIILDFFGDYVGTFLEVGAYDGITGSNTRGLSDRGWSGVCIEPSVKAFADLIWNHRENPRNVQCLLAALAPITGIIQFGDTHDQVSRCNPHETPGATIEEYFIAGLSPVDFVKRFGDAWDFVSIDVEGMETELFPHLGPILAHTKLVCFEDARPYFGFEPHYYAGLLKVLAGFGFDRLVGRTSADTISANTLLGRRDDQTHHHRQEPADPTGAIPAASLAPD